MLLTRRSEPAVRSSATSIFGYRPGTNFDKKACSIKRFLFTFARSFQHRKYSAGLNPTVTAPVGILAVHKHEDKSHLTQKSWHNFP